MPEATFILCAITSFVSALLLFRAAFGKGGRLLFWSAVAFVGLMLNNVLLVVDAIVVPGRDWSLAPNLVALASISILVYALVWEST